MNKNIVYANELISAIEAGKLLGISRQAIYQWVEAGKLIPEIIAGKKFFKKSDIMKLKLERGLKVDSDLLRVCEIKL